MPAGYWPRWLAVLALCAVVMAPVAAKAETRSLKFYHLHTREKAEIVYKRNGRYVPEGLKKINHLMRDWRRNEVVEMDPRLLDMVWEAYRQAGATGYIQVICGYRAPATNNMLRSRSRGVAKKSQHMLGKAIDFYIPGVPLKKLRDIALRMQGGGVGYYPSSGSPFVHMDVGNVRHWPGISRQELARVFPDGKTLHIPSDGKPLPGYEQALAAYKARKARGQPNIELASAGSTKKSGGLLTALFGGGADEAEDNAEVALVAAAPKKAVKSAAPAPAEKPGIKIVSPDKAKRSEVPLFDEAGAPQQEAVETPETIIAALPARSIPLPAFAPRPKTDVGAQTPDTVPFGIADAAEVAEAAPQVAAAVPESVPFGMADPAAARTIDPAAAVRASTASMVPVPSWRPDRADALAEQAPTNQGAVMLALAETAERGNAAREALSALPSPRPDEIRDLLDKEPAEEAATDSYQVASLAPTPRSAFSDPHGVDAASPRVAVAARPAGTDPVAAIGGNVKTTRKEARARPQDARPDPKPLVVAAQPQLARWALYGGEALANPDDGKNVPRLAYNFVRTAPTEVYTLGFRNDDMMANANRFTGSAVTFISVARFQK